MNIVSPFLAIRAIEAGKIPELIREYSQNITINIYTDLNLNEGLERSSPNPKSNPTKFERAKQMLEEAGANVILVHNVHSKIIAIDGKVIVEGSFNWLSAERLMDKHKREESSILYKGERVKEFIRSALDPVRSRIINKKLMQNTLRSVISVN